MEGEVTKEGTEGHFEGDGYISHKDEWFLVTHQSGDGFVDVCVYQIKCHQIVYFQYVWFLRKIFLTKAVERESEKLLSQRISPGVRKPGPEDPIEKKIHLSFRIQ